MSNENMTCFDYYFTSQMDTSYERYTFIIYIKWKNFLSHLACHYALFQERILEFVFYYHASS